MFWTIAAALSAAIWAGLLLARGRFWRADQRLPDAPDPGNWPDVVAVIPARDEAESIAEVVAAHAATDYPGRFALVVVDDASSDGTPDLARAAAAGSGREVHVIAAPDLPAGWTGKLNAVAAGVRAAGEIAPEARWLLLTDADIRHAPGTLRRLVALGEARGLTLVSLMARLDARGLWGGLLIPAFVFFFQKLYPFPLVNDPRSRVFGAAGGCMLVRRAALEAGGGIAAIRDRVIDDCALGGLLKRQGTVWLGLADREAVSLRDNRALSSIWSMVARTAYTQLRHSPLLLAGTVLGMALTYLAGPLAVLLAPFHGNWPAALLGALAWSLMALAWAPTLRLYARPLWQGFLLPVAGLLYTGMTISSAIAHWKGRGGRWKGRSYP